MLCMHADVIFSNNRTNNFNYLKVFTWKLISRSVVKVTH